MSARVKPELLGGFRDFLPAEMVVRQRMLETIRRVYERFGFKPLETPALERSCVLGTDSPGFGMEVYRFQADGQDVTLRFDLTVPLSRVVAANPEMPRPFKRYQMGNVWRREKPQAGRFREFAQFDVDIVGASSMLADAEIISIIYTVMMELGVKDIKIRFNNRKILNALPELAGFGPEKIKPVLRAIDKLEKVGLDGVRDELSRKPDNEFDDSAADLSSDSIAKVVDFLELKGETGELLEKLDRLMAVSQIGAEGVRELREICQYLAIYGVPQEYWGVDLSVARGLDYYTGPVFETTLLALPQFGSIMSGGRFDGLISRFTGQSVPAVGVSIGVDRLFAALQKLDRLPVNQGAMHVLIVNWQDSHIKERLELAARLRARGINTELYFAGNAPLKEQMVYALKTGASFLLLLGEKEIGVGKITLRDLRTRQQEEILLEECLARLSSGQDGTP